MLPKSNAEWDLFYREEFLKDLPTIILILRIIFICVCSTIGLEYVTKRIGWNILRPSVILTYIYDTIFHPTAIWLGYMYADVMGFLYAVDISELVDCVGDVGLPLMRICFVFVPLMNAVPERASLTSSVDTVFAGTIIVILQIILHLMLGLWNFYLILIDIVIMALVIASCKTASTRAKDAIQARELANTICHSPETPPPRRKRRQRH